MPAVSLQSLRTRDRQPEVMDQPGLDVGLHRQALRGLGRINSVSRTAQHFWPPLERLSNALGGKPVRVLDIACGGGDVAIALSEMAMRKGVAVEVLGCDLSSTALAYARERMQRRGVEVGFFEHDVLEEPLPECDAVVCSLFLHHLSRANVVKLLLAVRNSATRVLQISDLVRSPLGYVLAQVGSLLLTRSKVVHTDGPLSAAAAFTTTEVTDLAARAGLESPMIYRCFPERFHLIWRRS